MRATMGLMQRIAEEFRDEGTYSQMLDGAIPYVEAYRLIEATRGKAKASA